MGTDMTVPCDEGLINIRVGAIIMRGNKILMVGNKARPEFFRTELKQPWDGVKKILADERRS